MRGPRAGHLVIVAGLAAAALLIGVELQRGALADGRLAVADPCTRAAPGYEDGVDAQAQTDRPRGGGCGGLPAGDGP